MHPSSSSSSAKPESDSSRACYRFLEKATTRSMTLQFFLEALSDLGCPPPTPFVGGFAKCVDMQEWVSEGGFAINVPTRTDEELKKVRAELDISEQNLISQSTFCTSQQSIPNPYPLHPFSPRQF
jgi:hypothetical protein